MRAPFGLSLPLFACANYLLAAFWATVVPALALDTTDVDNATVCSHIARAVSRRSGVYYPGDANYTRDISHWSTGAIQDALCSVEPGSAADVGVVLRILSSSRTRFAVKGGGHSPNPGFSGIGTGGVQIAMYRFDEVDYRAYDDAKKEGEYDAPAEAEGERAGTVTVGTGLTWDEVYAALEGDGGSGSGVSVVGGRVAGVGVAGFALGGGYSWLTNQYGLTVDSVLEFELVKPDGRVSSVTQRSDPDLFFGLKGGHNNFGIVTKIVLKAIPQGPVWGGAMVYTPDHIVEFKAAIMRFAREVTDPKAEIITNFLSVDSQIILVASLFYDAPTPPAQIFDDFVSIPAVQADLATRSLGKHVASFQEDNGGVTSDKRILFESVPILEYSEAVLDAMSNETSFWLQYFAEQGHDVQVSYAIEPFLPSAFTQNNAPTAYPPSRQIQALPSNVEFQWTSAELDEVVADAMRRSRAQIVNAAIADGQAALVAASHYPNYALYGTPLEKMFGDNLPRLRAIRRRVDPEDVMGLTGGFRF